MQIIEDKTSMLTPSRILDRILGAKQVFKDYTFIILGKPGPTGKTWFCDQLKSNGFKAIDISENIYGLVDYAGEHDHFLVDEFQKVITIVLNQPLMKEFSVRKPY